MSKNQRRGEHEAKKPKKENTRLHPSRRAERLGHCRKAQSPRPRQEIAPGAATETNANRRSILQSQEGGE